MDMIVFASLVILAIAIVFAYNGLKNKQKNDSVLRQRAVFNSSEQITFTRLKEVLPEANILAHVSFDALLTTKYSHTRRKYQKMFANFVILDKDCRVIAVVALDDPNLVKRSSATIYQYALLEMATYRVIRYTKVPEYQQLRADFLMEPAQMQSIDAEYPAIFGKLNLYRDQASKTRIFG
ncbi:DUF2726 domain-containing protein [Acinetobacter sp. ANC 4648]|uniref:DUF2726 domain-containing protein n=1 Tax=Acinetobacter sp. ANC 4648 TaxID=1977875 RepID=UPI000A32EB87|nr:DUF2726 domain-containing protein [Acinetobacter sp. ANC 4648]OTG81177.1 hypothetical protein B9T27_12070 [Acinetobacter sp. ANC 4648]